MKPKPKIRVVLTNRSAAFWCSPECMIRLKKLFHYRVPNCERYPSFRSGDWDGYRTLLLRGRVGAGLFLVKKKKLRKKYRLVIDDQREFPKFRSGEKNSDKRRTRKEDK